MTTTTPVVIQPLLHDAEIYKIWSESNAEWHQLIGSKPDRNNHFARAVEAEVIRRTAPVAPTFQQRVQPWMMECFGEMIAGDREERNHRFLEEAIELVQSTGCTASEAHQLVDYVYGRPVGEPVQEVGGVMVTLAALCLANGLDMHAAAETELARIWTMVEPIRAKQAAKPKHSPLPDGWKLVKQARLDEIAKCAADPSEPCYRGRNVYDENKVHGNWEACRSQLSSITEEIEGIWAGWDDEDLQEALTTAPKAVPVSTDRWRERWHGSGGVSGLQGWSIINDRTSELVAYLGTNVSSDAVSEIVMAHNSVTPTQPNHGVKYDD